MLNDRVFVTLVFLLITLAIGCGITAYLIIDILIETI